MTAQDGIESSTIFSFCGVKSLLAGKATEPFSKPMPRNKVRQPLWRLTTPRPRNGAGRPPAVEVRDYSASAKPAWRDVIRYNRAHVCSIALLLIVERDHALTDRNSTAHIYAEVTRAAYLGLAVNFLLGATKLAGGIVGNSFALIADAVNSIGDVVTTVVVLFALHVAQRPADAEHPYGHTRAEGIAASNVAVLIIVSAALIGWEAMQRITVQHEIPPPWTLWIAGVNVLIKEALYQYKVRVGRRTGSAAIIANAWDHRSDAFCSLAVLIGLSAIRIGGARYIWADEAASLVVVAAIVWSGVQLFRSTARELMDAQADSEYVDNIRTVAATVAGVEGVETLWVRKSGLEYFADIHIEVNPDLSVAEGHQIGHRVKDRLLDEVSTLRDVLVHLEPHPHSDPKPEEKTKPSDNRLE